MNTLKRLLNKRRTVFITLMIAGFVVTVFTPNSAVGAGVNFKFSGDTMNLLAVVGGVVTLWQIVASSIEGIRREIASIIEGIEKESSERDRYHDEAIASIKARIEAIATQHEQHQSLIGHTGSLNYILRIQQDLADIKASVAAYTRQGEIFLKLQELEAQMSQIIDESV